MEISELRRKYLNGDFTLKSAFQSTNNEREEVLTRAERYAGWTLPVAFPDDPLNEHDEMQNDYQSLGAQAVTNLANKMSMALLPPNKPFFRTELTKVQKEQIIATGMEEAQIEATLAKAEREAMKELNKQNTRVAANSAFTSLIITGNSLLEEVPNGSMQQYTMRDYVQKRDLQGEIVKLIIRQSKDVEGLDDDLAALCKASNYQDSDTVNIYTGVQRVGANTYIVWQELEDLAYCHKKIGKYNIDTLPYIPLTWNLARGKDNGTGLVENYSGDFHTLSTLSEAILDYTTIMTDMKTLVNPAGSTDVRELKEAPSGAYVYGREEDLHIHTPQVAHVTDFLTQQSESVGRRIAAAFLMNSLVTRDAERVTAEEIRRQAHELEGTLGGVYSRLANELQFPLAIRLMRKVAPVMKDMEPVIVTGLDSLARNSDLDNLRAFFRDLLALSEVPPQVAERIEYTNLIAILGAGHGVDYKSFLKSDKEVAQSRKEDTAQVADQEGQIAQAQAVAKE